MFAIRTGNATRFGRLDVSGSTVRTTAGWSLTSRAKEQGTVRGTDDLFVAGAEREDRGRPEGRTGEVDPFQERIAGAHAGDPGIGDALGGGERPADRRRRPRGWRLSIRSASRSAARCGRRRRDRSRRRRWRPALSLGSMVELDVLDRHQGAGQRAGEIRDQQDARRDRRRGRFAGEQRWRYCRRRGRRAARCERSARSRRAAGASATIRRRPRRRAPRSVRPISSPSPRRTTGTVTGLRSEIDDRGVEPDGAIAVRDWAAPRCRSRPDWRAPRARRRRRR